MKIFIGLLSAITSISVLTLVSNVSNNKRRKLVRRKSVVPRLLVPLKRRNKKKRRKRKRRNLRPSRKKRQKRYAANFLAHPFKIPVSTDKQILLSLLVLRLRNKRQRLLTQQRRLEGSSAQKKELRWVLGIYTNYIAFRVVWRVKK